MTIKFYLSVVVLAYSFFISSAYGYIDPNTGGFFFQTVAPFIYGILGVMVVFWKRITGFFRGMIGRSRNKEEKSLGKKD